MGYKELWEENTKDYNELARKRLDDYCKIEKLDKKIDEQRKELNGIYKVIEMNADDIQELQDKLNNELK